MLTGQKEVQLLVIFFLVNTEMLMIQILQLLADGKLKMMF